MTAIRAGAWRSLIAPGLASLVALCILIGLGVWQVERKAWKEGLITRIVSQSKAEPVAPPAAAAWDPAAEEFRHVRIAGHFLNDKETLVHGLAAGETPGRALQGYYVITPFVRDGGGTVLVNRGFVPTELKRQDDRKAGLIDGETTVTGILRASEPRGMFVPEPDPARGEWFNRDVPASPPPASSPTSPPTSWRRMPCPARRPGPGAGSSGWICRTTTCNTHSRGSASPPVWSGCSRSMRGAVFMSRLTIPPGACPERLASRIPADADESCREWLENSRSFPRL